MKLRISISWVLAGCLAAAPGLRGQQPANGAGQSAQDKPAAQNNAADKGQKPAQAPPQSNANPFP
ncbi:MAG: hypothetical protein WBE76_19695, partial [Terracidiphilus sp.]